MRFQALPFDRIGLYCLLGLVLWPTLWKNTKFSVGRVKDDLSTATENIGLGLEWWQGYSRVFLPPPGTTQVTVQSSEELENVWKTHVSLDSSYSQTNAGRRVYISLIKSVVVRSVFLVPRGVAVLIHGDKENITLERTRKHNTHRSRCASSTRLFVIDGSLVLSNLRIEGHADHRSDTTLKVKEGISTGDDELCMRGNEDNLTTSGSELAEFTSGGAILCRPGSTVALSGCLIAGHSASDGGAVAVLHNSNFTAMGTLFSGNRAEIRAVNSAGNLSGISDSAKCEENDRGEVTRSTARAAGGGGAIVIFGSGKARLKDVVFENNTASTGGAMAIFENQNRTGTAPGTSRVECTRTSFIRNVAIDSYGGGVAIYSLVDSSSSRHTFKDCSFSHNVAARAGGAIHYSCITHTHKNEGLPTSSNPSLRLPPPAFEISRMYFESNEARCTYGDESTPCSQNIGIDISPRDGITSSTTKNPEATGKHFLLKKLSALKCAETSPISVDGFTVRHSVEILSSSRNKTANRELNEKDKYLLESGNGILCSSGVI